MRVVYTKDENDLRSAMDQMVRKFAPEELKKKVQEEFVEELKKK